MSTSNQPIESAYPHDPAFQRHYSIQQIADLWGWDYGKVKRLFQNEPGVICTYSDGTLKKRRYVCRKVPESVMIRVHHRIGVQQ